MRTWYLSYLPPADRFGEPPLHEPHAAPQRKLAGPQDEGDVVRHEAPREDVEPVLLPDAPQRLDEQRGDATSANGRSPRPARQYTWYAPPTTNIHGVRGIVSLPVSRRGDNQELSGM